VVAAEAASQFIDFGAPNTEKNGGCTRKSYRKSKDFRRVLGISWNFYISIKKRNQVVMISGV
jgi:hypothetical protein